MKRIAFFTLLLASLALFLLLVAAPRPDRPAGQGQSPLLAMGPAEQLAGATASPQPAATVKATVPPAPTETAPSPAASATTATASPTPVATPLPAETASPFATAAASPAPSPAPSITPTPLHPLSIAALRRGHYPGSELVAEETLTPGAGYNRYIASYQSDGLTLYGLLTVPTGDPPAEGWPAIIINHGYIPSYEYDTAETYKAHADGFARHQYVVFVPDYRGHANSEGTATAAYGSPDYTVDVLNALASLKQHPAVDPGRIGMFGHSLGGYITLRVMVARDDIQAGVIWAGVVSPYSDFYYGLERRFGNRPTPTPGADRLIRRRWWQTLAETYGTPAENPAFWDEISANTFLEDISGPLQLHHGTADEVVPVAYSETLKEQMDELHRYAALNLYEGDDHNLTQSFTPAMITSISFFDRYVKGTGAGS